MISTAQYSEWQQFIDFSPATKAARVFGAIATILGSFATLLVCFGSCMRSCCGSSTTTTTTTTTSDLGRRRDSWTYLTGGVLMGAFVCQCFTFLVFVQVRNDMGCASGTDSDGRDVDCEVGSGGIWSILACICYLLAGIMVFVFGHDVPSENQQLSKLVACGHRTMTRIGIVYPKQDPFCSSTHQHRWQDIALLLVSLIGFIFSLEVLLGCRFFRTEFTDDNNNTNNDDENEYLRGLFYYYYYPDNSCRRFERGSLTSFTATTRAAIAMGIMATIVGGIVMVMLWTMILIADVKPAVYYQALPVLAFVAALSQSLTFLANQERQDVLCEGDMTDCSLAGDGILAAINTCVFMMFIPALWWYGKNRNINPRDDGSDMDHEEEDAKLDKGTPEQGITPSEKDIEEMEHIEDMEQEVIITPEEDIETNRKDL